MAQRRMFSQKIINSARFIKMPASSQMLYFHFGLNADDDGIVEGYGLMRMLNCSEDDLKILTAKGFITILNEDLVTFINDWHEHNLIRSDRKVDSIYKNLLIKIIPEVNLIESRPRQDLKAQKDAKILQNGRPDAAECPHRLGKVRLGKVEHIPLPLSVEDSNSDEFGEQEHQTKLDIICKNAIANWKQITGEMCIEFTLTEWDAIYGYAMAKPSMPPHTIRGTLLLLNKWANEGLDIAVSLLTGFESRSLRQPFMLIQEDARGTRLSRQQVIGKRLQTIKDEKVV